MPKSLIVTNADMTAVARAALQYLAERHSRASEAAAVAEWVGKSLPKVQAGLIELREGGHVRYFAGHPGSWSVTPSGYAEINVATASVDRYKMALESILAATSYDHEAMRRIAKKALDG